MRDVIALGAVLECNGYLAEKGLCFRVHLRDACGKQSCYLEALEEVNGGSIEEVHRALSEFFAGQGYRLSFSGEGLDFWLDGRSGGGL